MTYQEKLKDPRWQKKRLEVLERAGWKCEDCGTTTEELQVHHCAYAKGREPWEYTSNSLMCLCDGCHEYRQAAEAACKQWLSVILRFAKPDAVDRWKSKMASIVCRIPEYKPEAE